VRYDLPARRALDADLDAVRRDGVLVLHLDALDDLVRDPEVDPFMRRRGPSRAGIDDAAATLGGLPRVPGELTLRVVVPHDATAEHVARAEDALHRCAAERSSIAWREGMLQRAMGMRQLPAGLALTVASWVVAYLAGYAATQVDGAGVGLLAVTSMIAITIAWVVSWMVVEATMLDWRPGARQAAVYDLLARARLDVVADGRTEESGRWPDA
jgi:hypothetical protein